MKHVFSCVNNINVLCVNDHDVINDVKKHDFRDPGVKYQKTSILTCVLKFNNDEYDDTTTCINS